MLFDAVYHPMKDSRTCILRPGKPEDAQGMLDCLRASCAETPYLLRTAEECEYMTVEGEQRWLQSCVEDPQCMMIVAEVDGEIVGNCEIRFGFRPKQRHKASIGIAIRQKVWGQGIGTQMFRMMLDQAARRKQSGLRLVELEFIEGNSRARALYEKMGFRVVGIHPNAILREDGTLCAEYFMQLML